MNNQRPNKFKYIYPKSIEPLIKHINIPRIQIDRKQKKLEEETYDSEACELTFDKETGKYILVGGYTTYYAGLEVFHENQLLLCKVYDDLTTSEQYLHTLDWMFKNRIINWYNRHYVVEKLHGELNIPIQDIADFVIKETNRILFYLNPEERYRSRAIAMNEESAINKINQEPFQHLHNIDFLCNVVLNQRQHITDQQLTFIGWLRGNGINFEKQNLTREQEHALIQKALSLKDDFLLEIRFLINEMRVENGDPPVFHFDFL